MSVSGLPHTLFKRWYLALVGLVVTIGLVAAAAIAVPVSYEAKANLVLIPPANSASNGDNPLLGLTGLQSAADVLARAMSDPVEVNKLKQQGVTGKYTVARDLTTDGPVLVVTVDGDDSGGVLRELKLILADMPTILSQVQQSASVAKSDQIRLLTLNTADKPTSDRKSQLRAVIVAVVLGLVLTMLIVNVGDRLARRRRPSGVESDERLAEAAAAPDDVSEPMPGAGASASRSPAETGTVAPKPAAPPAPAPVPAGEVAQADDGHLSALNGSAAPVAAGEVAQPDDGHPSAPKGPAAPVPAGEVDQPDDGHPSSTPNGSATPVAADEAEEMTPADDGHPSTPNGSATPVAADEAEEITPADDGHPSAPNGSATPVAAGNGRPRNGRRPNPLPPDVHVAAPVGYRAVQINGTEINRHAVGPQRALESDVVRAAPPAPSSAARPAVPANHAPAPAPNPDGASARSRIRRLSRSSRGG
jgi:hypothetical protein